jgi:hypothetical protein
LQVGSALVEEVDHAFRTSKDGEERSETEPREALMLALIPFRFSLLSQEVPPREAQEDKGRIVRLALEEPEGREDTTAAALGIKDAHSSSR